MLIGGDWRESSDAARFDVIDPATGDVVGTVPDASDRDVRAAIEAAAGALEQWRTVPAVERARLLRRSADLIRERTGRIAAVMTAEQGKPLTEAAAEVEYAPGSSSGSRGRPSASTGRLSRPRVPTSAFSCCAKQSA